MRWAMNEMHISTGNPTNMLSGLYLVGGLNPSEKYMNVNWDDDLPNISGKIQKMATKPPARYGGVLKWGYPQMVGL